MSDAETLIGCEIQIPRHERAELEPGASYVGDLVGCIVRVREDGAERALGPVEDVQFGAGEAPLLVVREGRREFLIPFAEAYIRRVDTQGRTILMELPEGMLELDAPLSQEEKDAQKRHE